MKILPHYGPGPSPEKLGRNVSEREKGFAKFLEEKLSEADRVQKEALRNLQDFASGKSTDLTELTLSLAKADLSFRLVVRVRNKVLEAYQEIMRMQI